MSMENTELDESSVREFEREDAVLELERLLRCYQCASFYERNIVWSVLNKYAPVCS